MGVKRQFWKDEKKASQDNRTERVMSRITKEEKQGLKRKAYEKNQSISTFLRNIIKIFLRSNK